jgi:hypothetical protein
VLIATRYLVGALLLFITADGPALAQDVVAVSGTITTHARTARRFTAPSSRSSERTAVRPRPMHVDDTRCWYSVRLCEPVVLQLHAPAAGRSAVPGEMADRSRRGRSSRRLHDRGRAQNLFDVFRDRNITVHSFNGIQSFPGHSPFGMNGRTLYLRLGRTF